ncbi:MAG: LTA synthase family protein [bacterium]|nr:LTA synthase family protein [bacterium]
MKAGTAISFTQALHIYGVGFLFDTVYYLYVLIPISLYFWLIPDKLWATRLNELFLHVMVFVTIYVMGFTMIGEYLFWDEFNVRFNFISVDYLVYRREVSNNILESYPVFPLLAALAVITFLVYYATMRRAVKAVIEVREPFKRRTILALANFALAGLFVVTIGQHLRSGESNVQVRELASNGPYQLFAAFRNNELSYMEFYAVLDELVAGQLLRLEVGEPAATFTSSEGFDITRTIDNPGAPRYNNVMLVMVESFSAKFMATFGNKKNLTPVLDGLADKSLFFNQMYATGTRTTRGLEAMTLSIPPTPGRSIVKRIGKERDLFSLGNVLGTKGYDVRFLYGGRGYFDNMNSFFDGNGYKTIDELSVPDDEIGFENAWGMADEYLFDQALKSADEAQKSGKPFFFHVMTTSNHRPYTYPDGRVDIPSGSHRHGAVKYSDWAIGDFLKKARTKRWFDKTLFVIVADHTAGGAGKQDLPVSRYHIPAMIYAPKLVDPKRIDTIASQIDLAPSILALLNMDYKSFFYGRNIFDVPKGEGRALIANYQYLGYYNKEGLSVLGPRKSARKFTFKPDGSVDKVVENAADPHTQIAKAYYEGAYLAFDKKLNKWKP